MLKATLKLRLHTHVYIENTQTYLCFCILTNDNKGLQYLICKAHDITFSSYTCSAISAFRNDSCVMDVFNRKPRKKNKSLWLSNINYVKLWRNNNSCLIERVSMDHHSTVMPWSIRFVQIILHVCVRLPVIFNSLAARGFYISLSSVPQHANKECCLFQLPWRPIFNHFGFLMT